MDLMVIASWGKQEWRCQPASLRSPIGWLSCILDFRSFFFPSAGLRMDFSESDSETGWDFDIVHSADPGVRWARANAKPFEGLTILSAYCVARGD